VIRYSEHHLKSRLETELELGAKRLLSRAEESYGLKFEVVSGRLRKGVEKYLLTDDPDTKPQEIAQFLDGIHATDLCIVVACETGNEKAWSDLISRFGATVRSAARSVAGTEDAAEDLSQSIWAELHGLRSGGDRPNGKIGYYSGRGSLGGWLRAVVGQMAIDQHRKQSRFVQTEEDGELDRISNSSEERQGDPGKISTAPDPEASLLAVSSASAVESALEKAVGRLSAEDRMLVKLYYFDGLRLREAGAVLGVHEATASRRLSRVHTEIRKSVEELLINEHKWTISDVQSGLSQAAAILQSDVEAMLSGHDPPMESAQMKL
jgi:RNA polymerase sigma-70 factor (ECF subfamily)